VAQRCKYNKELQSKTAVIAYLSLECVLLEFICNALVMNIN